MIRKAQIFDIPKINELGLQINNKFNEHFKMNEIINESISLVLVYEINDEVVGFLHATILYEVVDIINIVVDIEHRRQNIASSLFDYLLSELDSNINLITLEVDINNQAAIKLYENFGFEIISVRKNYYKDHDAYLMGRTIK